MRNKSYIVILLFYVVPLFLGSFFYIKYLNKKKSENITALFIKAYEEEEYDTADSLIRNVIHRTPENALAYAYAGLVQERSWEMRYPSFTNDTLIQFKNENLIVAKRLYKQSLALSPFDDRHLHNMGWLFFFNQEYDSALFYVRQAVRIRPSVAVYRLSEGLMLENGNQIDQAFNCFATAIRLSPDIVDSKFMKDVSRRHPKRAVQMRSLVEDGLQKAVNRNRSPILLARLGKIYLYNGKISQAQKSFREVTAKLPNLNRVWMYLAVANQALKDTTQFTYLLKKSHLLDKSDYLPCLALGDFYYQRGEINLSIYYNGIGLQNWLRRKTEYSFRSKKFYNSDVVKNDIIPEYLLHYVSPEINEAKVLGQLATALRQTGNSGLRALCDSVRNKLAPIHLIKEQNFIYYKSR